MRKLRLYEPSRRLKAFLAPPDYPGARVTAKRLLNAYLVRYQHARGDIRLRGYPLALTIESTNACNLRCPYCFTGAGELGRDKSMLQMPLYSRVIDELGDYLWQAEFYNWGEPLLNKNIARMIAMASAKGIGTTISSNLSIPLDVARAEELVASGLSILGVSLDGATQETYEKYRVRGKLDLVLHNVALLNDAKRKLRSASPSLVWEFHVFDHNKHEIADARRMAAELDMTISVDKGWVIGPESDPRGEYQFFARAKPGRCDYLWRRAIVHNDGGVAPCCGTFYREDDFGAIRTEPSVRLSELEALTFRDVWNNSSFQDARRMFRSRATASSSTRGLVCYDCPQTTSWEAYRAHLARGERGATFDPGFTANDGFNYFFDRKPARAIRGRPPDDQLISLEQISSPTTKPAV